MMEMKSTIMKRVWEIGEGFKHSVEDVEAGLIEILNLNKDAEMLSYVRDAITLGGQSVINVKNKETQEVEAEIKVEKVEAEVDSFGDLINEHMIVTYINRL